VLERIFQEPGFRVCCLGGIKLVEVGSGTDMTPTSRKTRALIGYLCIVGKPVARERLASLLWGDRGDEQARASLRQAIYELRSLLGGDHLVRTERDTVAVGDAVGTDVAAITAAAQSGDLEQLAGALAEWRGDVLEDLSSIDPSFDAWLQAERVRVQEHLVDVAVAAVQAGMAKGEFEPARRVVNLLQQRDGTNEVVLRLGLRLDHLAGDSAALHRRYERFRELLKSELGASPAAETQQLFQELARTPSRPAPLPSDDLAAQDVQAESDRGAAAPASAQSPAAGHSGPAVRSAFRSGRRTAAIAVAVALAFLCALAGVIWVSLYKAAPPREEPLLAVLPFQSLSDDPQSQYYSRGLPDDIENRLSGTGKLRVALAPAGFRSDRTGAPHAPAATHVLSGSVERVGGRIRVIAQLMSIADDSVVWSHAYDTGTASGPAPRHAIAVQIAAALGKLLASGSFGEPPRANAVAYDHFLKGRRLYLERYPRAAIAELEASVRLDPAFANGWAALAAARRLLAADMPVENGKPYNPALTRAAGDAARRALALEPHNAEALGVLAMLMPATRLREIDSQLERALRFEPNNAQVLAWHGEFLLYVGRNYEALNELARAYVLGPATPYAAPDLALASMKARRYDEGREVMDIIDRDRDDRLRSAFFDLHVKYFAYGHDWFGLATWLSALPDRLSLRKAAFLRLCRETALALATRDVDKFDSLRARWRAEPDIDADVAVQFLTALGDDDGALQVVQSAVRSRRNREPLTDPGWEALFVPDLIPLRRDPRIPALFADWGLADYWRTTNHSPDFMR